MKRAALLFLLSLSLCAAPVEQVYPALVPFIELPDGRVLAAALWAAARAGPCRCTRFTRRAV